MTKPIHQVRRDARRNELVVAAVKAIRRYGPGVSMDQMAAEAGVTKPILYRYFGDRSGLVAAIGERIFTEIGTELGDTLSAQMTPRQLATCIIDAFLRFIESDPDVYRFLARRTTIEPSESGASFKWYVWRAGDLVAEMMGNGLRAAGRDPEPAGVWAFALAGMVHAAAEWWMEQGTIDRGRLAEYLAALICDGLPDIDSLGMTGGHLVDFWGQLEESGGKDRDFVPGS